MGIVFCFLDWGAWQACVAVDAQYLDGIFLLLNVTSLTPRIKNDSENAR